MDMANPTESQHSDVKKDKFTGDRERRERMGGTDRPMSGENKGNQADKTGSNPENVQNPMINKDKGNYGKDIKGDFNKDKGGMNQSKDINKDFKGGYQGGKTGQGQTGQTGQTSQIGEEE